ncbi:MAG: acyl carrier protein [Lachnospiraceae bacterium]|nr:acyl carrier protein [Lachnospiraceae bacterium]
MEFEKLKEAIADILNVDPNEVTEETTFTEDLGADSLDVYQIVMKIEEAFEIEIPAETIKEISTVGEAVLVIRNCI